MSLTTFSWKSELQNTPAKLERKGQGKRHKGQGSRQTKPGPRTLSTRLGATKGLKLGVTHFLKTDLSAALLWVEEFSPHIVGELTPKWL